MLDDWSPHALRNSNLYPDRILNLMTILREYKMKSALKNMENLMNNFYNEFAAFKDTPDFLRLTRANLHTILSSDYFPIKEIEVFECACRWAKAECERRKMEVSDENLRLVLGNCLYEIRFPLMAPQEFAQCVNTNNILTLAESFEVFKFISFNEAQRVHSDISKLDFNTKSRIGTVQSHRQSKVGREVKPEFSILDLTMDFPVVDNPPFVCDGSKKHHWIITKRKILVHGLGFLGPNDEDAVYDVIVRFENYEDVDQDEPFALKTHAKRIHARKGVVFRIMFDQPVTINEGSLDTWKNHYCIIYFLKGPNTKSFKSSRRNRFTIRDGVNSFRMWWESNQLAEILYTNE